MSNFNIISGEELVRKGLTGHEASLPEVGLKDVVPNGSWLEQKQIQSALETKKGLIEIERIEKIGSISQAEWKKDLNLAEVTQKVGGYWKFLGHNVGSILYLNPEEALYLMEIDIYLFNFNLTCILNDCLWQLQCQDYVNVTFITRQFTSFASTISYYIQQNDIFEPKDIKT